MTDYQYFDALAEQWYDQTDPTAAARRKHAQLQREWILNKLHGDFAVPKPLVLDIGCGGGLLANQLSKANFPLVGIDLSLNSLRIARKYDEMQQVSYLRANAFALPFAANSFDLVLLLDMLEHFTTVATCLQEVQRVLKPGGRLFFQTITRTFRAKIIAERLLNKKLHARIHTYRQFITPAELTQVLSAHHLDLLDMQGVNLKINRNFFQAALFQKHHDRLEMEMTPKITMNYIGVAQKR